MQTLQDPIFRLAIVPTMLGLLPFLCPVILIRDLVAAHLELGTLEGFPACKRARSGILRRWCPLPRLPNGQSP